MGAGKTDTAKIFTTGRSQAVRLPKAYRFNQKEVAIRRDPETGDVILSSRPDGWNRLLSALEGLDVPADFPDSRHPADRPRDPLDWHEQK